MEGKLKQNSRADARILHDTAIITC